MLLFQAATIQPIALNNSGYMQRIANFGLFSGHPIQLPDLLIDYKLPITFSFFAFLSLVTIILFAIEREHRAQVAQKLATDAEVSINPHGYPQQLLKHALRVRMAFIVGLVCLFLFVLLTYQYYNNQIYTMVFASGIFLLNIVGTYFFGSLRRIKETEQLVDKLRAHINQNKIVQQNLLASERRLQEQHASLASLAAMQLNKKFSPRVFIRQLIRQAAETMRTDRVSVWLYSKEKDVLVCDALYDLSTKSYSHGQVLKAEDLPHYFDAIAESRVLAVNHAMAAVCTQELAREYLPKHHIGAILDTSIWQDDALIGVLCHEHVGEARDWQLDEQNYAGSLADLIRLAFELQKRQEVETDLIAHQENVETMIAHRIALIENNAKLFRFLVERAPVSILYMNAANEILEMNPETERISGYKRSDAIGQKYENLFVPAEQQEAHMRDFQDVMQGKVVQGRDLKIKREDGSIIDLSISRRMELDAEGNPVVISIGQDISQKKALEASLIKAREAAEEADRIKSMFVASMSHELRTPLNSIIGFIGVVLQGMSGDLNAKQKDQLNRAYFSAKHLLSLISDVIDISKIEAGYIEANPEKVNIESVLEEVFQTLEHLILEKDLAFSVACDQHLTIETDRRRFFQVVLNLVSNAVKYTEEGHVKVVVKPFKKNVKISVEDTGIGIDEAGIARLFKPFERIDSHLKMKILGTGLGLYLTKNILSLILGGEINVKSELKKGSTFTLVLPYKIPKIDMPAMSSILE